MAKTIISNGKLVPQDLLNQIAIDKIKELQSDAFNKDIHDNSQRELGKYEEEEPQYQQHPHIQQPTQNPRQYSQQQYSQQQYLQQPMQNTQYSQQQQYAQRHHQQHPHHPHHPQPNINKYAVEYANYIGQKPRATASARIKLGGVY